MSDRWDFYFCTLDNEPASISLDMGIAGQIPISGYGAFGYVRVYMQHPRPDGLSSNEEFETLCAIDDSLTEAVTSGGAAHYFGRATCGGTRDYYFYLRDPSGLTERAAQGMRAHPTYEYETGHREDSDGEVYRSIYPGGRDVQRMQNRKVIEALREQNDALTASRQIEHWAYFPELSAARRFAETITLEGFEVSACGQSGTSENFVVRFARDDSPESIDEITVPLFEQAQALGGEYDGWECQVMMAH
ncbi:DUF695 domain-containing protein [Sphingomonas sp. AOB5]|uniref:DUF695 domain-containing protein n=1 Tax=Sphingomonas sp. AOB5 TaxID=3034017 RepID=UPI0023F850B9|nr:DUF695 domain-containing protein [Sphingomonas sp. AOB5]MDF7774158.1 DUF695 domain-containing protein [Sphingomonas sp. AOB5]